MGTILTDKEQRFAIADILVQYCHDHVKQRQDAIEAIADLINTQKRLYAESVKEQADDMARFIAALLIQSGGSVKVTKRTLEEIPLPSSVNFERFDNVDGSIEFRLKDEG